MPLGSTEVGSARQHGRCVRTVPAVEVPEIALVREKEKSAIRGPLRLLDRDPLAARNCRSISKGAGRVDVSYVQIGRDPGHVGMPPAQPCETRSIRTERGGRIKIPAGVERRLRSRSKVDRNQLVDRMNQVAAGSPLAHYDEAVAFGIDADIGEQALGARAELRRRSAGRLSIELAVV